MTTPPLPDSATIPIWQAALVLAPALCTGIAALAITPERGMAAAWRLARLGSLLALLFAAVGATAVAFGASGHFGWLEADRLGATVLLLVAFLGEVIVRYSRSYMDGQPAEREYVRWLLLTLTGVAVVLTTSHLLLLTLAWTATGLALHRLLTFFGDRPAAALAAHKKFLVSRIADLLMLAAIAALDFTFGTLQLDDVLHACVTAKELPAGASFAAVAIALAALLKCAQLPFHGWLLQVMEAPTPVSALLHAGVVNLGGFVLMRFAPLIEAVPAAQALLVVGGGATAVVAALVTSTRISVKVMLAWSTCAQMGFMLMQCGLGAFEMALLHLLAHSLYKAHAFLAAGGVVRQTMVRRLAPAAPAPGAIALAFGAAASVGMAALAARAWGTDLGHEPGLWVLATIFALSLLPLLHLRALRLGGAWPAGLLLGAGAAAFAWFGLHELFASWFPPAHTPPPMVLCWLAGAMFLALHAVQLVIALWPRSAFVQRLHLWCYGGFYLDELCCRVVLRLWPPPRPLLASTPGPLPASVRFVTETRQ